jgi:hypothetical protein
MRKKKKTRHPRQYALVKHVPYPEEKRSPFPKGARLVYLGEIPNMPGYCVVVDCKSGRIRTGYHTERFEEIPQEET